jgi:hypothetical protein
MTEKDTTATGFFLDQLGVKVTDAYNTINAAIGSLRAKPALAERTLANSYTLVDAFLTLLALEYNIVVPPALRSKMMGIALVCAQMGRDDTTPKEEEK